MRSGWSLPGESPSYDGPNDFDSWDRCTTRGMPSSMMPYRYNGGFTIWQAPGVVVFDLEMIHDARVIFTDGRALKSAHKLMGASRGRWEGNTLVVETTNYRGGHAPMINLAVVGSPAGNRFPHSDQMKTTERITRLNNDMWLYEIKTEDPVILTAPFTVRYPMKNDPPTRGGSMPATRATRSFRTTRTRRGTSARIRRSNRSCRRSNWRLLTRVEAQPVDRHRPRSRSRHPRKSRKH